MPHFYRNPSPTLPLTQGDIFHQIPKMGVRFSSSVVSQVTAIDNNNEHVKVSQIHPSQITTGTVLLEEVKLIDAIVLSQSCDTARADMILLAEISPFPLDQKTADKKWARINHVATSLGDPKLIYLPGNSILNFPRRFASLDNIFTLPREFLLAYTADRRAASLGNDAILYLQYRIGVLLTRMAQDDYAWPSQEDLLIKQEKINNEIAEAKKKIGKLQTKQVTSALTDDEQQDLREHQNEIDYKTGQISEIETLLPNADAVG